jgi:hypothetical protein
MLRLDGLPSAISPEQTPEDFSTLRDRQSPATSCVHPLITRSVMATLRAVPDPDVATTLNR